MSKKSYQIDVDLDVFKCLTAKIEAEGQDHNDVLRDILNLDSPIEGELPQPLEGASGFVQGIYGDHFYSRGLLLPNGTELRSRYKGEPFFGKISNGKWLAADGQFHSSPSAAAAAITGTTVNGWRFWEAKRPGDTGWRRLDMLSGK